MSYHFLILIFFRTSSAKELQQEDVWGSLQEFNTESQKSPAAASENLVATFQIYSKNRLDSENDIFVRFAMCGSCLRWRNQKYLFDNYHETKLIWRYL